MTDDEIISRFNDLNVQIIHVKSQFDQLLQSFNVYVNLEQKLDQYKQQLEAYQNVMSSFAATSNAITKENFELKEKITKIENRMSDQFLKEEFDYTAPLSPDCDNCSV